MSEHRQLKSGNSDLPRRPETNVQKAVSLIGELNHLLIDMAQQGVECDLKVERVTPGDDISPGSLGQEHPNPPDARQVNGEFTLKLGEVF